MRFQTKIILASLTILVLTLGLNSLLSISSFGNVYEKSLISTYEAGGKNLKRKIEQSLQFGKPLDNFQGMEKLLEDFISQNQNILFSGITDNSNKIIYHSNPEQIGKTRKKDVPESNNYHLSFIPLHSSPDKTEGYLFFGFSSKIVSNKIKEMIFSNLKVLILVLFVTGFFLVFLLKILIALPLKLKIRKILKNLYNLENNFNKESSLKKDNEIHNLEMSIQNFSSSYLKSRTEIELFKNEFAQLKKEAREKISKSQEEIKKYLKTNPEIYKSFELRNQKILNYLKICSELIESDDLTGKKNNV
jgi:uncharacterized membrane protein YciS (DUF1049 family)